MPRTEEFTEQVRRLFYDNRCEEEDRLRSINATLQVTDGCNLACTYCYQINKHSNFMPAEVGKRFIDMLLTGSGHLERYVPHLPLDCIVLEFIGGEPFLAIDLVAELTDYFFQRLIELHHPALHRSRISICSNGVLYFDERVQRYIRKHKGHLSFGVSVDGNKALHDACRVFPDGSGSYDLAMAAVNHYRDVLGGYMNSKMTIAPGNVAHTCEAVVSMIEAGYKEINLNCVYEAGWTVEHARILYRELVDLADYMLERGDPDLYVSMFEQNFFRPKRAGDVDNWCGGNGRMIACDWRGDLYPCIRYMESSLGEDIEPLKIGNVDTGVMETDKEQACVRRLKAIDRRSQSTDKCFSCPIAEGCSWCTAYNYQVFGTPDARATYICVMHQARALANAYYWNKKFRAAGENKRMKLWIPEDWALEIISKEEWQYLKDLEGIKHV